MSRACHSLHACAGMRAELAGHLSITHCDAVHPLSIRAEEQPGVFAQLKTGLISKNPKFVGTCLYFLFVAAFFWVMTGAQGGEKSYDLVQNLRAAMAEFTDVSDHAGWFAFMQKTFPDVVFPVEYYNGQALEEENLGNVANYFMLLGAVGVRQLRAKDNTCNLKKSDKIFPNVKNCFGEYSILKNDDTTPFGPTVEPGTDRKFKYSTSTDLGCTSGCMITAQLATYGGGGFFELLPSERSNKTNSAVKEKIAQLKKDRWLDRQTRAVFVDFAVYSLTTKLMATVQLWYETKASGKTSAYIQVIPLKMNHLYISEGSSADLISEFIVIFLTMLYSANAVRDWFRVGCYEFWGSGWNVFDIINYLCMYAAFLMRYLGVINAANFKFPPPDTDFVYLSATANWVKSYKYALGFNCIFTFFKILKYLSHIPMFARLVKVLGACVEDVAAFLINLAIMAFAFAGAFHLTYGNHMLEFATMGETFMTLYRFSMGDWDVGALQAFQPDIGIFYFMLWTLLAICLLLNMFVGIIMESYDKVNEQEEKMSMFEYVKKMTATEEVEVVVSNEV